MEEELRASEALYGFCGWLTSRKKRTIMSCNDDAAVVADLIKQFCKINKLSEPRSGWPKKVKFPK